MSDNPQGLLFVFGECGPEVTEAEFNDWYDNEHVPARAAVPGFLSLARYKAIDSQTPTWLATYDLSSPSVMQTDAYTRLFANASDNERDIISRLSQLNRRIYTLVSSHTLPTTSVSSIPAKLIFAVSIETTPEGEAEFNRWYEEEHMGLLAKVPGWLRGRRYKLVGHAELAGKADNSAAKAPCTYLAIHELDQHGFMQTPEFKHALGTPWREQVMKTVVDRELRLFERYKVFETQKQ